MDQHLISELGDELYAALRARKTLSPLTTHHPEISIDDAYHISLHMLQRRIAAGEQLVGKKIGVTSKAVQDMLDVHQPDFGFLTDAMHYPNGACISLSKSGLIQPRAEGEIAFILKEDLHGNVTREDILDATEWVLPCFEIVDSRITDWKIRIQDTVADNASCGVFVLGDKRTAPRELDLASVRLDVLRNGLAAGSGLGSAVQGHPAEAVAWLANTLGRFGIPFRAGEIILSGALAPLVPASAGDRFELTIEGLGAASVSFID
ncbi:fumarylacetoacetate hydrolase family protein [Pseudomonas sp. PDM28]|uniref:fumarylacetoacetate hydrolase family protein n=1 Tax=Pseudomonas sp. PDM28 TaxID=2854770 RepID=UPI001C43C487|nr:fumarylacetoacetate hydrolase family protein [Pseudomonas sp. PDM28]MBV7551426.1 fumarylacetoacetate hydrolase family protein [Pseudomonas sp. PDM28]